MNFFAPATADFIDGLIAQHRAREAKIRALAHHMATAANDGTDRYFFEATNKEQRHTTVYVSWDADAAVSILNTESWNRALNETGLLKIMPANRLNEWNDTLTKHRCPPFTDETVRATIDDLFACREKFFAERVDGVFRALSGEHVTNQPQGFYKRMIMARVVNEWGSVDYRKANVISDLLVVIYALMRGRVFDRFDASGMIDRLKSCYGEWQYVHGNMLKIKLFKNGNLHLEVHPDLAWQMNRVLATLYPSAIPPASRSKPAKPSKEWVALIETLPPEVLTLLENMRLASWNRLDERFEWHGADKHVKARAAQVLQMLGGVPRDGGWDFDYSVGPIMREILMTRAVPDSISHQYYPTPESVARVVAAAAAVVDGEQCLEPSAGMGSLVEACAPGGQWTLVELSSLRCKVLEQKNLGIVHHSDFMKWETQQQFDAIVMNPPFDQQRWIYHLEAASRMLRPNGRLVAVLPASAIGKPILDVGLGDDWTYEWSSPIANEFEGTGISVTVLTARLKQV